MPKSAKNSQNLPLSDQKIPNFEFSHRYYYSYTLEDTYENILGSFQPKIMTKFLAGKIFWSKKFFFEFFSYFCLKNVMSEPKTSYELKKISPP